MPIPALSRRRLLGGLVLLLFLGCLPAAGGAAGAAPARRIGLEDVVHPNTVLFFRLFDFSRLGTDLESTAVGKAARHPEVADFLDTLDVRRDQLINRVSEESDLDRETVAAFFRGQWSVAYLGVNPRRGEHMACYGINFPAPPAREKVYTILKTFFQRVADSRILAATNTIEGAEVLTLTLPEVYYFALLDNLLLITRHESVLKDTIRRYQQGPRGMALGRTPTFRKVAAGSGVQGNNSFLFVNTRLAMPVMMRLTSRETVELLDALGMRSVEGIGGSAVFVADGLRTTLYLHAPRQRTGILQVVLFEEGAEEMARTLPEDAGFMMSARVDMVHMYHELPRLYEAVREAVPWLREQDAATEGTRLVATGLRTLMGLKEIFGIPIEEVLRTLGDSVVFHHGPAGTAIRFDRCDTAAFEKVIARMEQALEEDPDFASGEFTSLPEGDKVLRYYNQSGHPVPMAPSYVILDESTVMVASHPQVLKAILRHPAGKTLAGSADFQHVMTGLPEGLGGLYYIDSTASYARVYDALIPFLNGLTAWPAVTVDPGNLPPGNELTPFVFGTAVGVRNAPEGVTVISYSPIGIFGGLVYAFDRMIVSNPATMSLAAGFFAHSFGLEGAARILEEVSAEGEEPAAEELAPRPADGAESAGPPAP